MNQTLPLTPESEHDTSLTPMDTFQGKCLLIGTAHGAPVWVYYEKRSGKFWRFFRRDPFKDLNENDDKIEWVDINPLLEMGIPDTSIEDAHHDVRHRIRETWLHYFHNGARAPALAEDREVFSIPAPLHKLRARIRKDIEDSLKDARSKRAQESQNDTAETPEHRKWRLSLANATTPRASASRTTNSLHGESGLEERDDHSFDLIQDKPTTLRRSIRDIRRVRSCKSPPLAAVLRGACRPVLEDRSNTASSTAALTNPCLPTGKRSYPSCSANELEEEDDEEPPSSFIKREDNDFDRNQSWRVYKADLDRATQSRAENDAQIEWKIRIRDTINAEIKAEEEKRGENNDTIGFLQRLMNQHSG